ncbi:MAG: M3 family metallopeptidase [Flammeovirgaceae bacterium]
MNPLLKEKFLTPFETLPFSSIQHEHFLPALKEAIAKAKKEIEEIKTNPDEPSFENTIEHLERTGLLVERISEVFFNLNSANTDDQMQKIAQEFSPLLTEYSNDVILDKELFQRVKFVYENHNTLTLTTEQKTLLEKTYKTFVRNGANLSPNDKEKLREIDKKLSTTCLKFGENVLAETNNFLLEITDKQDLAGLPDFLIEAASEDAKQRGKEGSWVFSLHAPSYIPFMTYAENRNLREKLFKAFASKAFKGDEYDNQKIIKEIVRLRHQRANLLGYDTHAHFILEERMAQNPKKVTDFLNDILKKAKPVALEQIEELKQYMKKLGVNHPLERWDFAFYSEKLKKEKFAINDELLKPYFQLENVVQGVFTVAHKLYGISFREDKSIEVYHPEVTAYEVLDENGKHLAVFYADFFPRKSKRAGAWMTSFRGQRKMNGENMRPHVSIVCNFTKPTSTKPSLLTLDEVLTLFHEMGHALHLILADGMYGSLSGTNVYWDFVELPSQILENWVYEKDCLDLFARHYQTGESIPLELIERIKASANFMEGYQTLRQLSFGLLDMAWHDNENAINVENIDEFEKEVIKETDLFPPVQGCNSSCSFSHIFNGGYSAGYYSYKWAEVLDADAFELFKQNGIFDKKTAKAFQELLSKGGSEHPMTLYKRFRGKEPSPDALLKRAGLLK